MHKRSEPLVIIETRQTYRAVLSEPKLVIPECYQAEETPAEPEAMMETSIPQVEAEPPRVASEKDPGPRKRSREVVEGDGEVWSGISVKAGPPPTKKDGPQKKKRKKNNNGAQRAS